MLAGRLYAYDRGSAKYAVLHGRLEDRPEELADLWDGRRGRARVGEIGEEAADLGRPDRGELFTAEPRQDVASELRAVALHRLRLQVPL